MSQGGTGTQKPPKVPPQNQGTGNGSDGSDSNGSLPDWATNVPDIQKMPLGEEEDGTVLGIGFDKGKKEFNFDLYGHLKKPINPGNFSEGNDEEECRDACDVHCANLLTACKGNCTLAFNSACVNAQAVTQSCHLLCGPIPPCHVACENAFDAACNENNLDDCKDACETINENDCIDPCYDNC
ncbi:MAG: hypothetical protein ABIA76_04155 [Candidatus Diapherotrites archaeon]